MVSVRYLKKLITVKSLILKCKTTSSYSVSQHGSGVKCSNSSNSELGEAPIWNPQRKSLFWVDIISKHLHEKPIEADYELSWELPVAPSSLALDANDTNWLWVLTETHLCKFNLCSNNLFYITPLKIKPGFRTNDGSVGPDGRFWFGTMMWKPENSKGQILSIGTQGDVRLEFDHIAIPNTFCWVSSNEVLITDSLKGTCLLYDVDNSTAKTFIDYSHQNFTPDGGAVDTDGNVWIALWGAGKVACFNPAGSLLHEISLPIEQPSSCCFGGPDLKTLFITSAREGLKDDLSENYALSGRVFQVNVPAQGAKVLQFNG